MRQKLPTSNTHTNSHWRQFKSYVTLQTNLHRLSLAANDNMIFCEQSEISAATWLLLLPLLATLPRWNLLFLYGKTNVCASNCQRVNVKSIQFNQLITRKNVAVERHCNCKRQRRQLIVRGRPTVIRAANWQSAKWKKKRTHIFTLLLSCFSLQVAIVISSHLIWMLTMCVQLNGHFLLRASRLSAQLCFHSSCKLQAARSRKCQREDELSSKIANKPILNWLPD